MLITTQLSPVTLRQVTEQYRDDRPTNKRTNERTNGGAEIAGLDIGGRGCKSEL